MGQVLSRQVQAGQVHAGQYCAPPALPRVSEQGVAPEYSGELSVRKADEFSVGRVSIHARISARYGSIGDVRAGMVNISCRCRASVRKAQRRRVGKTGTRVEPRIGTDDV